MSSIKVTLNNAGIRALLKSSDMQAVLQAAGARVESNAGGGFKAKTHIGKKRAYVNVAAVTYKAKSMNRKHNTLLKALH